MCDYIFHIDTIKVVSFIQNIHEKLQFKYGSLRIVTIYGQKFKNIHVYEREEKFIRSLFKVYQDELPEDEDSILFATFNDIVRLLTMLDDSKFGFSTYYMKFCHGNNIFHHMLDRIRQINLNGGFPIGIIGFSISLKKERHNHCEFLPCE